MNATWKVEGEEGDVWFEGTEAECQTYCETYGYKYNKYVNPSQQRFVVYAMHAHK